MRDCVCLHHGAVVGEGPVELVVAQARESPLRCWACDGWAEVWGGDASVVYEEVDIPIDIGDVVDGSLEFLVRSHATLDWVEVAVFL